VLCMALGDLGELVICRELFQDQNAYLCDQLPSAHTRSSKQNMKAGAAKVEWWVQEQGALACGCWCLACT
jgi:hypothetical protein